MTATKRQLGRTGLQVTALGYGAMELRGAFRVFPGWSLDLGRITWDRGFESGFLQRRVSCEPEDDIDIARQKGLGRLCREPAAPATRSPRSPETTNGSSQGDKNQVCYIIK
jgi:hypothetical protein